MSKRSQRLRDLIRDFPPPDDVKLILEEMASESDRSAALIGAALLDTALGTLLKQAMKVKQTQLTSRLFENRGALSDFGSRVAVGVAFGIITETMAEELDTVRSIRNVFAHSVRKLTFETAAIKSELYKSVWLAIIRDKTNSMEPITENAKSDYVMLVRIAFILLEIELERKGGASLVSKG